MTDAHKMLGDIGIYSSVVGDGGPRMYRQRGKDLPDKYLPGRFFSRMDGASRAACIHAVTSPPADWWVRHVVSMTEGK